MQDGDTTPAGKRGEVVNLPVILVEQDLNTMAEELTTRDFTRGEITDFFQVAAPELDRILQRYFPAANEGVQ
jgi:hypothetical protein